MPCPPTGRGSDSFPRPLGTFDTTEHPLPITPDQAAEVARRHGLTLMDAAGLLNLAESTEDADRLAATFATTEAKDDDTEAREFAARLFRRKPATEPAPVPEPTPNTVPKEGSPVVIPDPSRELRKYTARLFDRPDQDTI